MHFNSPTLCCLLQLQIKEFWDILSYSILLYATSRRNNKTPLKQASLLLSTFVSPWGRIAGNIKKQHTAFIHGQTVQKQTSISGADESLEFHMHLLHVPVCSLWSYILTNPISFTNLLCLKQYRFCQPLNQIHLNLSTPFSRLISSYDWKNTTTNNKIV